MNASDLREEPFRVFFPLAVLAGLAGVALWPLHFGGFIEWYPGQGHTRLMGQGFFGGFILGFLGTSLPRLLGCAPFRSWQLGGCLLLFLVFVPANVFGNTRLADASFLALLLLFLASALVRVRTRRDVPPPGFVLVGLAMICGVSGTVIGLLEAWIELDTRWLILRPLLAYQGFILLPVLGVGAFILPRSLGLPNTHDFPKSIRPPPGWWAKAFQSLGVGLVILATFYLEVNGAYRTAYGLRVAAAALYLWHTVPAHRTGPRRSALDWPLRLGLLMILGGLGAVALWPGYRVALLHILLVGGLGVVTMLVATRVVYGHSGNRALLTGSNRWLGWSLGLIVLGMATRISGDYLPNIMVSHYNYGALCWSAGLMLWAWHVLPKVAVPDVEETTD